jgi:hypothetical protein
MTRLLLFWVVNWRRQLCELGLALAGFGVFVFVLGFTGGLNENDLLPAVLSLVFALVVIFGIAISEFELHLGLKSNAIVVA